MTAMFSSFYNTRFVGRNRRILGKVQSPTRILMTTKDHGESTSYSTINLLIPSAEDMEEVGALLSALVLASVEDRESDSSSSHKLGRTICLSGDLGAGKTAFSRGFIRAAVGDDQHRVTSPTYLLDNTYLAKPSSRGGSQIEIHHMDLYRLMSPSNDKLPVRETNEALKPLNLQHVFQNCISLIEWPSRLGEFTPTERLDIDIRMQSGSDSEILDEPEDDDRPRKMKLVPHGGWWRNLMKEIIDEGYVDDLILRQEDE